VSVIVALLSIAAIGVLAYLVFDCLIPKDPPDGERPSEP
jgi:phage shock protein PspC (stress-responsive transcriptional regulator)